MAYRHIRLHIAIIIAILALISSITYYCCTIASGCHVYPQDLITANYLCNTNPKKALTNLHALKSKTEKMSDADKWYYRLLLVKANDKNYIEAKNTDETQNIVNHYEKSYADKRLLPYAYYYLGSAYRDINNVPMALEFYKKAHKIANNDDEDFISALNFQIGFILLEQSLNKESLPYFWKSFSIERKQNDTKMMTYIMQKIAYAYQANNNDNCIAYYLKAAKLAQKSQDKEQYDEILSSLASYYIKERQYVKALKYACPALTHKDMGMKAKASFLEVMAASYKNLGNIDSATYYYHKLENIGIIEAKEVASKNLARIYNKKRNIDRAITYMDMHEECEDSIKKLNTIKAVAKWNSIYNYSSLKEKNAELEKKSLYQTFLIITFTLVIVFLSILFYLWHKKLVRNNIEKDLRLKELRDKINGDNAKKDKAFAKFFTLPSYSLIMKRVAEKIPLTDNDFHILDNNVNEIFPNFKPKLYTTYDISNRDYHLCLLIKMFSFNDTIIAVLMCRERSTISKAKKKLYLKILGKDSSIQEFEDYIKKL